MKFKKGSYVWVSKKILEANDKWSKAIMMAQKRGRFEDLFTKSHRVENEANHTPYLLEDNKYGINFDEKWLSKEDPNVITDWSKEFQ